MPEQRNLILAIVLSIVVIMAFQFLYELPRQQQAVEQQQALEQQQQASQPQDGQAGLAPAAPSVPGGPVQVPDFLRPSTSEILSQAPRIEIDTPRVHGSISLQGGRLDDLTLKQYFETVERQTEVTLLAPVGSLNPYVVEFGWLSSDSTMPNPTGDTVWQTNDSFLGPGNPVTLAWDNGAGLIFERRFEVDENYLFTVTQRVINQTDTTLTLYPYALTTRHGTPETVGFYILHEGPLGVFNETLSEVDYDDLVDDGPEAHTSTGGWLGITDKYWLVALVPNQTEAFNGRFVHTLRDGVDRYQADFRGEGRTLSPGDSVTAETRIFAGAKEVNLLDAYEQQFGIVNFDLAVDFGWFYFLTRPFFTFLDMIGSVVGNFGVAIILFTLVLRIILFPLANYSFKSMSGMKKLQPQMMELRDRYKEDKQKLQQEMMALYKREKVNPVSGCLPILIQIPIFFALYKVLFVTIEMRHAPFFGWIVDLSAPDPTSMFNLFGLIPWDPPQILMIGIWPLIMGFTMWLQMKLNPTPPDPLQAKIMMALPFVFTFMLASFPAGLVIYWATNNALSIAQQWVIMKRQGVANPVSQTGK